MCLATLLLSSSHSLLCSSQILSHGLDEARYRHSFGRHACPPSSSSPGFTHSRGSLPNHSPRPFSPPTLAWPSLSLSVRHVSDQRHPVAGAELSASLLADGLSGSEHLPASSTAPANHLDSAGGKQNDDAEAEKQSCDVATAPGSVDVDALNRRARLHYEKKEYSMAVKLYARASKMGSGLASADLATMYRNGEGVDQSDDEAARLYHRAIEQGCVGPIVLINRAHLHFEKEEYSEAFKLYAQASEMGDHDATACLASMYRFGKGVDQSDDEAVQLYDRAIEQGCVEPCVLSNRADLHHQNEEYFEAVKLYAQASEMGDHVASANLGSMYRFGKGAKQSDAEALRRYDLAIKQGCVEEDVIQVRDKLCEDREALTTRGNLHFEKEEYSQAFKLLTRASEMGCNIASSNLALMHYRGKGVEQSDAEAAGLYDLAITQGSKNPKVLTMRGIFHYNKEEYSQAFKLFTRASEMGDGDASANLANIHYHHMGKGVAKNHAEAAGLYDLAMTQGCKDPKVFINRADLHFEKEEYSQAVKLLTRASKMGYGEASAYLGVTYLKGKGVEQSDAEALLLLNLAINQGCVDGNVIKARDELTARLSANADAMAEELLAQEAAEASDAAKKKTKKKAKKKKKKQKKGDEPEGSAEVMLSEEVMPYDPTGPEIVEVAANDALEAEGGIAESTAAVEEEQIVSSSQQNTSPPLEEEKTASTKPFASNNLAASNGFSDATKSVNSCTTEA